MFNSSLNNENSVPGPSFATSNNSYGSLSVWTPEEQRILDEGLIKYAYEEKLVQYYSRIANDLQYKSVYDVARRVKFMNERQNREKRKGDHDLIRENQGGLDAFQFLPQENVWDLAAMPSCSVAQPNVSPYEPATITMGNGDGISTHCPTDELLEQNVKILCQISANIDALQLQENVPLFCEVKDNIMKLLNVQVIKSFENLPDAMKKVPPFNFSIDEAEVNSILLQTIFPTQK
ncbi:hypothetical protein TanjilG_23494 [Lupinus angustifolius]|uniref:Myb-like domain-containing protein n=1 Tax=Lupinus angustifolius TaxID=3871 RepID=A0A4P1R9Z1_LUPAN|nr:hypothetical protein TanjilG_23494 [Lupinus angustifolius]